MLRRLTFLYGLPLALILVANAIVVRADVLEQDGLATHFIAKPLLPSGAIRRSSADPNNGFYALSSDELWYQRNAVLWSAGYCFHESRAVRAFGNAACGYDQMYAVPLTSRDSDLIGLLEQPKPRRDVLSKYCATATSHAPKRVRLGFSAVLSSVIGVVPSIDACF